MTGRMSFFAELKRRNVFKVGIAYLLMGWVLLQGADFLLDLTGAPEWVIRVFAVAVIIGMPVALFFAWAFEMTPEGIKREHEVDRTQSITSQTGRKLDFTIIGILALVIVLMGVERYFFAGEEEIPATTPAEKILSSDPISVQTPKSIAVLPFADLSQAQDQGWFAEGLAEEILNALARTPDLMVSSRTSTFKYKGTTLDISQIAAELGVAHVLEGSVRSGGGRIRVTAQLIRADDGFHVWSENYDRDVADMISIQEDLARNIARALKTTMDPASLAEMTSVGTRSVEAYETYLRGRDLSIKAFRDSQGPQLFRQGYQQFEQARRIDPDFANAHWQASEYWKVQLTPSRTDSGTSDLAPVEMLAEFNERIDLAIRTAPTDIDRIGFLGHKAEVELRLRDAIQLYTEYLDARPNDELTRFNLVNVASMASEDEIRRQALARWRELGIKDEWVANAYVNEAYRVIDPSDASDFGLVMLQQWPTATGMIYQTHRTLMWAGRIIEARQLHDRFYRLQPDGSLLVAIRQACAEGRRQDAEEILTRLDPNENDYQSELWHMYRLLGRELDAVEVMRPLEESGVPYQLSSMMSYHKFDPSPYPSVMAVLEREGVNRPPAVEIPFKCPPPNGTPDPTLELLD